MEKQPISGRDIAVIVPVYNRKKVVLEALESVITQTELPGKLIIVDDGSNDGTSESVRSWISQCKAVFPLQLLCRNHQKASSARNYGLGYVETHRWVAFLDSDDLWPSNFLKRCCLAINQQLDAIAVTADRHCVEIETGKWTFKSSHNIVKDTTNWIFCKGGGGIGSASLFRRDKIVALGGYDETLPTGHDTALFLRLSLQGNWLYVPGEPVCYRRGIGKSRGEQIHIYEMYEDFRQQWARVHEKFLLETSLSSSSVYRRSIAQRWYRTGRQLASLRRVPEARRCFLKSIRWRFFNKAWLYLVWHW